MVDLSHYGGPAGQRTSWGGHLALAVSESSAPAWPPRDARPAACGHTSGILCERTVPVRSGIAFGTPRDSPSDGRLCRASTRNVHRIRSVLGFSAGFDAFGQDELPRGQLIRDAPRLRCSRVSPARRFVGRCPTFITELFDFRPTLYTRPALAVECRQSREKPRCVREDSHGRSWKVTSLVSVSSTTAAGGSSSLDPVETPPGLIRTVSPTVSCARRWE